MCLVKLKNIIDFWFGLYSFATFLCLQKSPERIVVVWFLSVFCVPDANELGHEPVAILGGGRTFLKVPQGQWKKARPSEASP